VERIFVILVVFMVGIVGLMLASNWYMQFWLDKLIRKKHEWIDFIVATSYVPPDWSEPYTKRIARLVAQKAAPHRIKAVEKKAQAAYQHRLAKLMQYVQYATLIDGDALRQQIKTDLSNAGAWWRESGGVIFEDAAQEADDEED